MVTIIFAHFAFQIKPPKPPGWLLKQQVPLRWKRGKHIMPRVWAKSQRAEGGQFFGGVLGSPGSSAEDGDLPAPQQVVLVQMETYRKWVGTTQLLSQIYLQGQNATIERSGADPEIVTLERSFQIGNFY